MRYSILFLFYFVFNVFYCSQNRLLEKCFNLDFSFRRAKTVKKINRDRLKFNGYDVSASFKFDGRYGTIDANLLLELKNIMPNQSELIEKLQVQFSGDRDAAIQKLGSTILKGDRETKLLWGNILLDILDKSSLLPDRVVITELFDLMNYLARDNKLIIAEKIVEKIRLNEEDIPKSNLMVAAIKISPFIAHTEQMLQILDELIRQTSVAEGTYAKRVSIQALTDRQIIPNFSEQEILDMAFKLKNQITSSETSEYQWQGLGRFFVFISDSALIKSFVAGLKETPKNPHGYTTFLKFVIPKVETIELKRKLLKELIQTLKETGPININKLSPSRIAQNNLIEIIPSLNINNRMFIFENLLPFLKISRINLTDYGRMFTADAAYIIDKVFESISNIDRKREIISRLFRLLDDNESRHNAMLCLSMVIPRIENDVDKLDYLNMIWDRVHDATDNEDLFLAAYGIQTLVNAHLSLESKYSQDFLEQLKFYRNSLSDDVEKEYFDFVNKQIYKIAEFFDSSGG